MKIQEKFKEKLGFREVFHMRKTGVSLRFCIGFYAVFAITSLLFVVLCCFWAFTKENLENSDKNKAFQEEIKDYNSGNTSKFLKNMAFEIKFNENKGKTPVFLFPMSFFSLKKGELPLVKHVKYREKHDFPENFFLLDVSLRKLALILPAISFESAKRDLWKEDSATLCLSLFFRENSAKTLVKNQGFCEGKKAQILRLWRFSEEKTKEECESRRACSDICEKKGLFYQENDYITDKLMNSLTCHRLFIAKNVCFMVNLTGFYKGGCYQGEAENYAAFEGKAHFFNTTRFFIRQEEDPYVKAVNAGLLDGFPKEFVKKTRFLQIFCVVTGVAGLVEILVGVAVGFVKKRRKWGWGGDAEREKFNQLEMSRDAIKL